MSTTQNKVSKQICIDEILEKLEERIGMYTFSWLDKKVLPMALEEDFAPEKVMTTDDLIKMDSDTVTQDDIIKVGLGSVLGGLDEVTRARVIAKYRSKFLPCKRMRDREEAAFDELMSLAETNDQVDEFIALAGGRTASQIEVIITNIKSNRQELGHLKPELQKIG